MKQALVRTTSSILLVSLAAACRTTSDEGIAGPQDAAPVTQEGQEAGQEGAPEMDWEAMGEMMAALAEPGEAHARLEPMVGTFDAEAKFWMMPGQDPMVTQASMTNEWVFGKRFLHGRYKGEFMGAPFEGIAYTGYDNAQGMYVGIWMDSMSTGIMPVSEGHASEDGKVITFTRESYDPMTQGHVQMREVARIEGPDRHVFEMYMEGPEGEMQVMEITYTRRK